MAATDELELIETVEPMLLYLTRQLGMLLLVVIPIVGNLADEGVVIRKTRLTVRRKSDRKTVYRILNIRYQGELDEDRARLKGDLTSMSTSEFLGKYGQVI
jgi:hypothetical protein